MTDATPTVKHGDIVPLTLTITDPATGEPVDLSDASLRVLLKATYGGGEAELLTVDPGTSDLATGVVGIILDATDRPTGDYSLEVEATQDGRIITAPSSGFGRLTIVADLG